MIESITLRNFQRHRKKVVHFGPGVTTIVGSTNAGKSTILRAIRVLMLNESIKGKLLRHGKESLTVKLKVDGKTVTRVKGKSNSYSLQDNVYKSFGMAKVPRDVEQLLQVDGVNFQRQMDPPFWFTETPGQVSRELNAIVNLEVIDAALANVVKEVRDAKATMDVTRARWQEARVKRNELKWVGDMAAEWRQVEEAGDRLKTSRQNRTALAIICAEAALLQRQAVTLRTVASRGLNALSAAEALAVQAAKRQKLVSLLGQAREASVLVKADLPDIAPLVKVRERADWVAERRGDLELLVDEAHKLEDEVCRLNAVAGALGKRLKRSTKVCPTCGQLIPLSSPPAETSTLPSTHRHSAATKRTG